MKGEAGRRGASRCGCRGSLPLCCRCDSGACPNTPLLLHVPFGASRRKAGVKLRVGGGAGAGTLKRLTWSASGEWKR